MAKVQEQNIVITVSKLVKENTTDQLVISQDVADALSSVAEQLLGDGVVVEVSLA
jgi:polysaccharide pyruvyl transferase WcaK-like protein